MAPDAGLLAEAAQGDQRAFAELVRRHFPAVYRVTWRMTKGAADTEDIVQEAFLKLWRNPAQVRDAQALRGWLMRVASNAVIDGARRMKPQELDSLPEPADPAPGAGEQIDRTKAAEEIHRAVSDLPDRQRLALAMVHFEGMSNIEAAEVMEVSVDALESLLARGRRALKQSLAASWRGLLVSLDGEGEGG